MDEILQKGKIPIIAGGTGFYIQSLLYDIEFTEEEDNTEIREELTKIYEENGAHFLHEMLREIDSENGILNIMVAKGKDVEITIADEKLNTTDFFIRLSWPS